MVRREGTGFECPDKQGLDKKRGSRGEVYDTKTRRKREKRLSGNNYYPSHHPGFSAYTCNPRSNPEGHDVRVATNRQRKQGRDESRKHQTLNQSKNRKGDARRERGAKFRWGVAKN